MALNDLERASALIRERRFAEARALLNTLDHPTAQSWIKRLEAIEAEILGDPFAGLEDEAAAENIRPNNLQQMAEGDLARLVSQMSTMGWKIGFQTNRTIDFTRRRAISAWIVVVLILLFSFLGSMIACGIMMTRPKIHVTIEALPNGKLRARSNEALLRGETPADILAQIEIIPNPMPYVVVIVFGIIAWIVSYYLLLRLY